MKNIMKLFLTHMVIFTILMLFVLLTPMTPYFVTVGGALIIPTLGLVSYLLVKKTRAANAANDTPAAKKAGARAAYTMGLTCFAFAANCAAVAVLGSVTSLLYLLMFIPTFAGAFFGGAFTHLGYERLEALNKA